MKYSVRYSDGSVDFQTDAQCSIAESACRLEPESENVLASALAAPMESPGFAEFTRSSRKLLFILCDGTRPTPTAAVLEHLYPDIASHPNVTFIIATGTHREPTENEFRKIFGRHHAEFMPRTVVHDSKNPGGNIFLGTTSRGTPVSLSRLVMESDGLVTINSVEPHYFAGYTGGRKSFLPGVAAYDSIERNHSHAAEPGAMPLALDGNPISEDMFEALDMLGDKRIFSVQTVMTPHESVCAAYAGDIRKTFLSAVDRAKEIYSVEVPQKANIVITVAPPPMDMDLYQSQKALEHGSLALEPDGVMILVSSCWDGIGDMGFYKQLQGWKDGDDVSSLLGENYMLGNHKVARLLNLLKRAEIFAVTGLPESTLTTARMRGFGSLQEAVDKAIDRMALSGRTPSILLLPSGSLTVPRAVGE